MPRDDIFDEIERLRAAGRPFCVATVVRTADATSAKAGAKAAIEEDGTILGHLGGACLKRAVRAAAAEALRDGTARMIRVKPSDKVVSLHDADGVRLFKSGCPSGGTADLLIEPYAPPPMLVIFGRTPIAVAAARHGALMGWRIAMEAGAAPADVEARVFEGGALAQLEPGASDFVLIASQGDGDLAALRAALSSPARRVSMIASRRKAAKLRETLKAEGASDADLARIAAPAGLDLGGVDPQEIAVSVVARIIGWIAEDRAAPAAEAPRNGDAAP